MHRGSQDEFGGRYGRRRGPSGSTLGVAGPGTCPLRRRLALPVLPEPAALPFNPVKPRMLREIRETLNRNMAQTRAGRPSVVLTVFFAAKTVLAARWYLRRAELGSRVRLDGKPDVVTAGRIVVGDSVQLYSRGARLQLITSAGATLEIGPKTLVNFGTTLVARQHVAIGANCHIGPHCTIMDNAMHQLDPELRLETPPSDPIIIEDNVWLGTRVIVMPGVTIGRDAAIGAGSVVTRDVPPRTLAAGVPARVVREL